MANPLEELRAAGQSIWLDFIRRGLITSGGLARFVREDYVTGVTSNPTIFQKAIAGSTDYDEALRELAAHGPISGYEAFLAIGSKDIRMAADVLRPVYDDTGGADGYVSFEAQAGSTEAMLAEARRMFEAVGRPNVMIKIPGVPEGVPAVEELIAEGINVNITLLFDVDAYESFARAYVRGLKKRLDAGQPVDRIGSVASFFVSRIDTKVDERLPEESDLRGKVAIANARLAYRRFRDIFSGADWERLRSAGAMLQRPLWASTGTKNPAYSDVLYVEELVARDTVNTMPEATLRAFADHGRVGPNVVGDNIQNEERVLREAAAAGIDITQVASECLAEGLAAFEKDFARLVEEIEKALQRERSNRGTASQPKELEERVERRLQLMAEQDICRRIWAGDHTVWKDDPTEITRPNRLGWLTIVDQMIEEAPALRRFADGAVADGFEDAVVLGMGGSSLAPEVMASTFGRQPGALEIHVLDTTVPADIRALENRIDLSKTLFIVASKSGTTIETLSHLAYFWQKRPEGKQFIAITDPGTPLERTGKERHFRRVFLNPDSMGGRYSALSYFGLVPAALAGVDLEGLLDRAREMQCACHYCVSPAENPGAWLGALIGEAALAGRDKLTFALPGEIATLGYWLEQLVAESTGKEGRGIIPVEGEPLGPARVYGRDRLFAALGDSAELKAMEASGHPVVRLPFSEKAQLGAEYFRWEFATAVAGYVLGINPFDQPNVQQAKDATAAVLKGESRPAIESQPLSSLLGQVKAGDYIAIQAFLPRSDDVRRSLDRARLSLRGRHKVATTVGFGPRYLHSTGQIHKGGPNTGVFIQLVDSVSEGLPIPGQPFSFGQLMRAQADGDFLTLQAAGRRVARVSLEELEAVSK